MAALAEGLNILQHADIGSSAQRGGRRNRAAASTPSSTSTTSTSPRSPRCGGAAASSVLAARPDRAALHDRPQLEVLRAGLRLRGGPLDGHRGDRRGRPAPVLTTALYSRFASRALGRLRQQGALGDAQAVRRARGEADLVDERPATRPRHPVGRRPELQGRRVRTRTRHARRRRAPRGQHRRPRDPRAPLGVQQRSARRPMRRRRCR